MSISRWFIANILYKKSPPPPWLGVHFQYEPIAMKIPKKYFLRPRLKNYPIISIVTPSFRQGSYIERTIKSVVDQEYPNLEYIIQDGGSNDETIEIIKNYEEKIKSWSSGQDRGQSNAINLGFEHATGEIMGYLNSDDLLLPGSLWYVAKYFESHPEVDVVYGHRVIIDSSDLEVGRWVLPPHTEKSFLWEDYIPQETLFWRRRIWDKAGGKIDEHFRFAMDWDLLLRFYKAGAKFKRLPRFLGAFRMHSQQKTTAEMLTIGCKEMESLIYRTHGCKMSTLAIKEKVLKYLIKHVVYHLFYRVGILRY